MLGIAHTLGDHIVTREEVEACCTERPMAASLADISARIANANAGRSRLGWRCSFGETALVIGYITDNGQLDVRTDDHPARAERVRTVSCRKVA